MVLGSADSGTRERENPGIKFQKAKHLISNWVHMNSPASPSSVSRILQDMSVAAFVLGLELVSAMRQRKESRTTDHHEREPVGDPLPQLLTFMRACTFVIDNSAWDLVLAGDFELENI